MTHKLHNPILFRKCSSFSMSQRILHGCRRSRRCTNRRSRRTNESRSSICLTTKSSGNSGRFSTRRMVRAAWLPSSAGFQIPSRTGASRTSSISPSCPNCAAADTARKFCRPSAGNTPTRASLSISKSKKIPRTPKNSNAGTAAANFTPATALTPPPSITSGKANTTGYSAQAAPK